MIGHRATAGLTLLCGLLFCAFAAQSASAQVGEAAVNTTAVTCVKVGVNKGDFSDAHCDKNVGKEKGEFAHEAFEKGDDKKTTQIEITNKETKNSTKDATTALLKATVVGVPTEISCLTATTAGAPKTSWIQNVETSGKHGITGTAFVLFKDCTVIKPLKCTVKEPIETIATLKGVEKLLPGKNEMGIEFAADGEKGAFAKLTLADDAEKKCALKGITFEVTGTATATGGTATQSEKHSGATSVFIPNKEVGAKEAEEMQTLKIGGKPAYFTGTFTTRMSGGGNPITLTTTT